MGRAGRGHNENNIKSNYKNKQQHRWERHRHGTGRPLRPTDSAARYIVTPLVVLLLLLPSACAEAAATPAAYQWHHHHENVFMFSIWTYFKLLRVSMGLF
jgi:hypothetical protein